MEEFLNTALRDFALISAAIFFVTFYIVIMK